MKANLLRRCAALVILFLLVGCSVPPASNNQPPANAPVVQPALVGQGWTIGIDPGHGWKDSSGAVGNGLREDDVTLDIAVRSKAILDKNGFQTFLSRTGYDTVHGLSYAAVAINAGNPDLAVSIHANSSKGTTGDGTEACYMMNTQWDKQSKSLADLLAASVSSELGLRNRGIFPENAGDRCARSNTTGWTQLYFHNFNAPAALIETAFLSNPVEADMLNRRSQDFAQAIADAIMAYVRNAGTPGDVPSGTSVVASTPVVVAGGTPTNTVMVFDASGSMGLRDPSGTVKLDAAIAAGTKIVDVIGAENEAAAGSPTNWLGIVSFNEMTAVHSSLVTDIAAVRSALQSLYAMGGTGMPEGLKTALGLFSGSSNGKSMIILLSDGMPNIGLNGEMDAATVEQQVLDLASQAKQQGICIYTVGLGDPSLGSTDDSGLNEDFLRQVAANSGCGTYQNAKDAWQLNNIYVGLRHASTGNMLLQKTGVIAQGQTVDVGKVDVPNQQSMILFTLNWPGSSLEPKLIDPQGTTVTPSYPGATFSNTSALASIIIKDPPQGSWQVLVTGVDVPEGTINYNAILSARPNPNPPAPKPATGAGFAFVVLVVVLAGGAVAVYVMMQMTRRNRPYAAGVPAAGTGASLIGSGGDLGGQLVVLVDGLVIGRSPSCQLRIRDRAVSRQHARLRCDGSRWYIQDLNSTGGTFVNGRRIDAGLLNNGDRIRVGNSEFVFRG